MRAHAEAWAVSSGEYSDYHVTCICPDEATAQAVADRLNDARESSFTEYRVEAFDFVDSPDRVRTYMTYIAEATYRDGVCSVRECGYAHTGIDAAFREPGMNQRKLGPDGCSITARADTREGALKMASDAMAKWRAERELDPQPTP